MTDTEKKTDNLKGAPEKEPQKKKGKEGSRKEALFQCEKETGKLKKELELLKEEKGRFHDKLSRLMADFENYKKRIEEDKSRWMKLANAEMARTILPVLDNLELAMESMKKTEEEGAETLIQGLELVVKQFYEVLKQNGIEVIEAKGKPFNPAYHDAMMSVETEGQEDEEIITEEFQKGFLLYGTVIRPARVKVSKRKVKE
ncbi:MAG TPA: nucleotide exchange factor GrpE [Firmicutes bacterium]|nr:nucleotide exchange factor GrpE [Bacillota bacterium]